MRNANGARKALDEARRAGLDLRVDGDHIVIDRPPDAVLSTELRARLLAFKAELLDLLRMEDLDSEWDGAAALDLVTTTVRSIAEKIAEDAQAAFRTHEWCSAEWDVERAAETRSWAALRSALARLEEVAAEKGGLRRC